MKIVITENKVFDLIYNYLDKTFDSNEIDWVYGMGEDENGYPDEYIKNKNLTIFYKGDWYGEEDTDIIFHYLEEEYYGDEPSGKPFRDKTPILDVMNEYSEHLDTMFGNHWKGPMKKWFQDNFNLPVKTVTTYY
jgi:hypothetical protein